MNQEKRVEQRNKKKSRGQLMGTVTVETFFVLKKKKTTNENCHTLTVGKYVLFVVFLPKLAGSAR